MGGSCRQSAGAAELLRVGDDAAQHHPGGRGPRRSRGLLSRTTRRRCRCRRSGRVVRPLCPRRRPLAQGGGVHVVHYGHAHAEAGGEDAPHVGAGIAGDVLIGVADDPAVSGPPVRRWRR